MEKLTQHAPPPPKSVNVIGWRRSCAGWGGGVEGGGCMVSIVGVVPVARHVAVGRCPPVTQLQCKGYFSEATPPVALVRGRLTTE